MNERFDGIIQFLTTWLNTNVLTAATAAPWLCAAVALGLALLTWSSVKSRIAKWVGDYIPGEMVKAALGALIGTGHLVIFIILIQVCGAVFQQMGMEPSVLIAVSNLAVAGIVIRLLTGMMSNRTLAQGTAMTVWIVVALHILGLDRKSVV